MSAVTFVVGLVLSVAVAAFVSRTVTVLVVDRHWRRERRVRRRALRRIERLTP